MFEHKEVVVTCEKNMVNANEYQKLLEPPTKHEKVSKGKWTDVSMINAINYNILRNVAIGI